MTVILQLRYRISNDASRKAASLRPFSLLQLQSNTTQTIRFPIFDHQTFSGHPQILNTSSENGPLMITALREREWINHLSP